MNATTKLAIAGGKPAVTLPTPRWPVVGDQEARWMNEVVQSGKWSWWGEHERAFCDEYARFIGTKHCLALANGTVTLQCALQAVGVVPGDEVIVPGLTWVATAQAALDIGANVVFVDIDADTMCIDAEAIERAITPRTKAIIPVHLYGCMADMDAIMGIAGKHALKVVEDVAHQHGSRWRGKSAGAIGDVGSYSFQQSKILTCGEGGAITCDDDDVFETIHCLKQVGWKSDLRTPGNRYGHNYRITEMQAVLLRGGLARLEAQNALREENVAYLRRKLHDIGGPLRLAARDPRVTRQAYYSLTMHFDPRSAGISRADYAGALAAEGVIVHSPYAPVYDAPLLNLYDRTSPVPFRDQRTIQNYSTLKLPNVERLTRESGLVMQHPYLLGDQTYTDQMVQAIEKVNARLDEVKRLAEERRPRSAAVAKS